MHGREVMSECRGHEDSASKVHDLSTRSKEAVEYTSSSNTRHPIKPDLLLPHRLLKHQTHLIRNASLIDSKLSLDIKRVIRLAHIVPNDEKVVGRDVFDRSVILQNVLTIHLVPQCRVVVCDRPYSVPGVGVLSGVCLEGQGGW